MAENENTSEQPDEERGWGTDIAIAAGPTIAVVTKHVLENRPKKEKPKKD